jgi:GNAT superfamily N-acetyltransferase
MSEVQIREARPEDDFAVGEILVRAFTEAYRLKLPHVVLPESRLRELRDTAGKRAVATVLVAELEGRVVGTVALFRPGAKGSEAWLPNAADLRQLAIEPGLHGRGLSKALLDAAEALAWEWGVDAICLHTRQGAEGVARLYVSRGYVRTPEGDIQAPHVMLEAHVKRRAGSPS